MQSVKRDTLEQTVKQCVFTLLMDWTVNQFVTALTINVITLTVAFDILKVHVRVNYLSKFEI